MPGNPDFDQASGFDSSQMRTLEQMKGSFIPRGRPLPPPNQQTVFPVRQANFNNSQFVKQCFLHLDNAEELQANLHSVLRSPWWLQHPNQQPPECMLDYFVNEFKCLFCDHIHADRKAALVCARAHIH